LRDWVFSRQRYWGEPIPLVYCEACAESVKKDNNNFSAGEKLNPGWVPLSDDKLPLELPKVDNYQPTDTGESPLSNIKDWVETKCPRCHGPAKRETDTMPNWAGSSWYFLRYLDPHNDKEFVSQEKLKYWTPVDWYNGGMEHTVLHLLYSRFWQIFFHEIGLVPTSEPYQKRTAQGMILDKKGDKMSKSRGNVVNPDEIVVQYGADTLRTYIMFMGPFDQAARWDLNGLIGVRRFLERIWILREKINPNIDSKNSPLKSLLNLTIKKVSEDIAKMHFNTAIAKMMELVNEMFKTTGFSQADYEILVKLISPFAPHLAEEIWSLLGHKECLVYASWPEYEEKFIEKGNVNLIVQVNGKIRDEIEFNLSEVEEKDATEAALSSPTVQKWLAGKEVKKIIYVKNKLVNIAV
jgi:leucyl-tRNA synthetase